MPNAIASDRIIEIAKDTYAIHGRIVHLQPGTFDLSDPKHAASLAAYAERLYTPGCTLQKGYGEDTVCDITGNASKGKVWPTVRRLQALPKEAQEAVRLYRDAGIRT